MTRLEIGAPAPAALTEVAEDADTARLVAQFQAGEARAFPVLYARYFDRIYNYARAALRNPHDAEDVVQQVFLKVSVALGRLDVRTPASFRAWLFTIARHTALDEIAARARVDPEQPDEISRKRGSDAGMDVSTTLHWLGDGDLAMFVDRLPETQRQTLVLRFALGFATEEIAAVLGRSAKAVRHLQARALETLASRLTAIGQGRERRVREPMRIRLRRAPVLGARRFALASAGRPLAGFGRGSLYGRL